MYFDQSPYEIKLEWGQRGAREASGRGDIIIIVDVLSFSSTVVTALDYGAEIFPYPPPINEKAKAYAKSAVPRWHGEGQNPQCMAATPCPPYLSVPPIMERSSCFAH